MVVRTATHSGLGAKPLDSSEASSPLRYSLAAYCVHTQHMPDLSFLGPKRAVRTVAIYKNIRTITSAMFHPSFKACQTMACRAAWEPVTQPR